MRIKVCIINYLNVCGKCCCLLPISKLHEYFALVISIRLGQRSFQRWHWLFCSILRKCHLESGSQVLTSSHPQSEPTTLPRGGEMNLMTDSISSSWRFVACSSCSTHKCFHTSACARRSGGRARALRTARQEPKRLCMPACLGAMLWGAGNRCSTV